MSANDESWERIGHNLEIDATPDGGLWDVALRDVDEDGFLVINEDDLIPLRDKLNEVIARMSGK